MGGEEIVFQDLSDEEGLSFTGKTSNVPKTFRAPKYAAQFVAPKRNTQSFTDLYNSDVKMTWVIEDLLPETGLLYIAGESGGGKTILAIQIAVDIVLGRNTLTWKRGEDVKPQKILILSLEMNKIEFVDRIRVMYPSLTEDEFKLLGEGLEVYTDFEPFEMWDTFHITELHHLMKQGNFTGCLIDSASVSFSEQPNDAAQINKSTGNLFRMRAELGVWNIVVAHTKKPQGDDKKKKPSDVSMHDLMGHSGFAQSASSILVLKRDDEKTEKSGGTSQTTQITNVKARFGVEGDHSFPAQLPSKKRVVHENVPLLFTRHSHVLPPLPKPRPGETVGKPIGTFSMTSGLDGIDLNLILEDDDL